MVMIFILAVFASSFISDNKIFAFYSSLVSVLIYNFFFLEPIFSLKVHDSGNIITFTTMFIVGFLTAVFTRRLKLQSKELTKRAYRTAILLENSEKLARVKSKQELWEQLGNQALKLLNLPIIIYPINKNNILSKPLLFFNDDKQMLKIVLVLMRLLLLNGLQQIKKEQVFVQIPCLMLMLCIYL